MVNREKFETHSAKAKDQKIKIGVGSNFFFFPPGEKPSWWEQQGSWGSEISPPLSRQWKSYRCDQWRWWTSDRGEEESGVPTRAGTWDLSSQTTEGDALMLVWRQARLPGEGRGRRWAWARWSEGAAQKEAKTGPAAAAPSQRCPWPEGQKAERRPSSGIPPFLFRREKRKNEKEALSK